jgi:hypothetical protein
LVQHTHQLYIINHHRSQDSRNTGADKCNCAHAYLSLAALAAHQRVALLELAPEPPAARVLRLALRARRAGRSLRNMCTW